MTAEEPCKIYYRGRQIGTAVAAVDKYGVRYYKFSADTDNGKWFKYLNNYRFASTQMLKRAVWTNGRGM